MDLRKCYGGLGQTALPGHATIGYQLPHEMAEDLVKRLNSEDLREG